MEDKKNSNQNQPPEKEEKSSKQELSDDQLDVSGGVIAITDLVCGKCGVNPCTCTNVV